MTKLENWSLIAQGNPYLAPEYRTCRLIGEVYGHKNPKKHPDGKTITTSRVVCTWNNLIITSTGSKYELGAVNPDYEKDFPNSKERVLNTLKNLDK